MLCRSQFAGRAQKAVSAYCESAQIQISSKELLVGKFAPEYESPNKLFIFNRYQPTIEAIESSRFVTIAQKLNSDTDASYFNDATAAVTCRPRVKVLPEPYSYQNPTETSWKENWWMNFGDSDLFHFYKTSLFAQDEIQTLEFPELAGCLGAIQLQPKMKPMTLENGCPIPFIFSGVHRIGSIMTEDIYGNAFEGATEDQLLKALIVNPCSDERFNIASMSAFGYMSGLYTPDQVNTYLRTAVKTFAMCVWQSTSGLNTNQTIIHTGNWGCGAFGNDLTMMTMVQYAAACLVGVNQIYFHAFDSKSAEVTRAALMKFDLELEKRLHMTADSIQSFLLSLERSWGSSNKT